MSNLTHRIPVTTTEKLQALDSQLFELRQQRVKILKHASAVKIISGILRALICRSNKLEGLLWRLTREFGVDDSIKLHVPGKFKQQGQFAKNIQFLYCPIQRPGRGDPRIPVAAHSLKKIIKTGEAVIVSGKPLIHEDLIKAVAEQQGVAHEGDYIKQPLATLNQIRLNGVQPFLPILALDAELTAEIGERVLRAAEKKGGICSLTA